MCANLDWYVALTLSSGYGPWIWLDPGCEAVRILAYYADIHGRAEKGCGSCLLIRECALQLHGSEIASDSDRGFDIVYRKDAALSVSSPFGRPGEAIEVFTLDSKCCYSISAVELRVS